MTLIALPQTALHLDTDFGYAMTQHKTIETMCKHISAVGLLNPLVVTKRDGRYVVIDGKKRFHAIKTLARRNKLPRTLHKIPCVVNDNEPLTARPSGSPVLLTEQDLAHHIIRADANGATYSEISEKFDCSEAVITQARSLSLLHPKLMLAFINNTINLSQAAALATLPNRDAQWDLLIKLGPFATEPEIIAAIAGGETVLELPNGEIMLLPTRKHLPRLRLVPSIVPEAVMSDVVVHAQKLRMAA